MLNTLIKTVETSRKDFITKPTLILKAAVYSVILQEPKLNCNNVVCI